MRIWPSDYAVLGGLVLVISATTVVCTVLLLPVRSAAPTIGRINALWLDDTEMGSYPAADVVIGVQHVRVALPRVSACHVGAPIRLIRSQNVLGEIYSPAALPCEPYGRGQAPLHRIERLKPPPGPQGPVD